MKSVETTPETKSVLTIPTAFTPNGDGLNDTFLVQSSVSLSSFHMVIYESTNVQIFESNDIKKGWDGKASGQPEPAGSYLWIIDYQAPGMAKITQNGYVQLVR